MLCLRNGASRVAWNLDWFVQLHLVHWLHRRQLDRLWLRRYHSLVRFPDPYLVPAYLVRGCRNWHLVHA